MPKCGKNYTIPLMVMLSEYEFEIIDRVSKKKGISRARLAREYIDRAIKEEKI